MTFTIKTEVKLSTIQGLGVFAQENISTGSIVWEYNPDIDKKLTRTEYESLSEKEKIYPYYAEDEGGYILCGDNAKFTNHSDDPNTEKINTTQTIAIKNIKPGDEITENYYHFDQLAENKLT